MQNGETVVLLVTSRDTGRWVLPKGWAEKHLSGAQLAAKEAFEEAGILGDVLSKPIGAYHYAKQLPQGKAVQCRVEVFVLHVAELLDEWPEMRQRHREWFTLSQAAMVVAEGELVTLLLKLGVAGSLVRTCLTSAPRLGETLPS